MAVLLTAGYALSRWTSYHNFEGRCLECHLTIPGKDEPPGIFIKDVSYMCLGCHTGLKELSHPVDVKASMKAPPNLPFDWKGMITCVTCHYVHKAGYGGAHLRTRATGEGFCLGCHGDLDKETHQTVLGSAHLKSTDIRKRMLRSTATEYVLDELSIRCLACHDALYAGDTLVESRTEIELLHMGNLTGLSHPVGVSYLDAKLKYHGAYRNIDDLPPEIKLFDGTVGCGTCHNPYSKRHYDLVMSNEGSALCLACHVK